MERFAVGDFCAKSRCCPHATLATAISEMCKKGVGEGRPQPETMLPRSGRNTDLHCCGKYTAPTGQQMQSLQYKLLFVFYLEGSTWRHTCRITTTAGDVDSSPALWYPQPILSQVTHARIISLLCCKDNRTATPDWGCPFLLFTHRHIALMLPLCKETLLWPCRVLRQKLLEMQDGAIQLSRMRITCRLRG